MSFNRNIIGTNSKEEILKLINSDKFKEIFFNNNIFDIIIFGSIITENFNEESDIDIAIIGEEKIKTTLDLELTLDLEEFLGRSIDLIDIKDEDIENIIKIEALNSNFVVSKTEKFNEEFERYDRLFKENIEFWNRLDKVVLENE